MTSTSRAKVVIAARTFVRVSLLSAAAAASPVILAAGVHANPGVSVPDADHELGMYGDPVAAAPYWREQHASDCGEMAVADVVGQITGHEPTERQMIALAETIPGAAGHGPIWKPMGTTDIADLPVLLWHYWINAENIQTQTDALARKLGKTTRSSSYSMPKQFGTSLGSETLQTTSWLSPVWIARPVWCISTTAVLVPGATSRFPLPSSSRRGHLTTTRPS